MAKAKPATAQMLRASEWARQFGLPREDFDYWDRTEGIISEERFNAIRKNIGK